MALPRALIFDLDDTLLDWSGMSVAIARTAGMVGRVRPDVDAARLEAANLAVWTAYWPEIESDWMLGLRESRAVQLEAWRRALELCGIDDPALTEYAREIFANEERSLHRLYDDAGRLLAAIGRRYPLAIITNGARDSQREKLRAVGIEAAFDVVVISAEVGIAKPDPRIFDLALGDLGVAARDAWFVGDSLRNDVGGAKAASLTAVWLNRTGAPRSAEDPTPDAEIASLDEVLGLLGL